MSGHRLREPQSLEAWEAWVEQLIVAAQERGEFDDLPSQGKPLQIEEAPFAGGLEVGFGILKNAGVAPYWIELEKEIRRASAALEATRARAAEVARRLPCEAPAPRAATDLPRQSGRRWQRPLRWAVSPTVSIVGPHPSNLRAELERLRRDYLDQTAALDHLIAQYNAAIPRDLWHLERPRLSPEAAAQAFDASIAANPDASG